MANRFWKAIVWPLFFFLLLGFLLMLVMAMASKGEAEISGLPPSLSDLGSHWARETVLAAVNAGVVSGYPDGTFRPDVQVTREEVAKMVFTAFPGAVGAKIKPYAPDYPDIRDRWSTPYLMSARFLTSGYADLTFKPGAPCSRFEAAMMLLKAKLLADGRSTVEQGRTLLWVPAPSEGTLEKVRSSSEVKAMVYGDEKADLQMFYRPMAVLLELGVLQGYGDRVGWASPVSRAEFCVLMERVLSLDLKKPGNYMGLYVQDGRLIHGVPVDSQRADAVIAAAGDFFEETYPDPYKRARALYHTFCVNYAYDYKALYNGTVPPKTVSHTISTGSGVCQNFAQLLEAYGGAAGLNVFYIDGTGVARGEAERHAWNMLVLGRKIVECDPTWGLTGIPFFDNFNSHRASGDFNWLPD